MLTIRYQKNIPTPTGPKGWCFILWLAFIAAGMLIFWGYFEQF